LYIDHVIGSKVVVHFCKSERVSDCYLKIERVLRYGRSCSIFKGLPLMHRV
jgi:hypothetical protein